jgi:hypothetical protein
LQIEADKGCAVMVASRDFQGPAAAGDPYRVPPGHLAAK